MRDLLEKALRIQEREYGAEHRLVATTLTNLGIAYGDLGDAQKKRDRNGKCGEEVVSMRQSALQIWRSRWYSCVLQAL